VGHRAAGLRIVRSLRSNFWTLRSRKRIYEELEPEQREFVDFVLSQYVDLGVDELQQERLPQLLAIKYHSQMEGIEALGGTDKARATFIGFQRELYSAAVE
jgi:type I restriction enzyme R subunit